MSVGFAWRELAGMKPTDPQTDQQCSPSEVVAPVRSTPCVDLGIALGDEKPEVEGGRKTLEGKSLHLIGVSGIAPGLIDRDDNPFGSPS